MANQTGRYTTTYDTLQQKQTVVTPVGKVITYSYDALNRKSQMQVLDAGVFTYSYDANNQLKTIQNPQAERTSFSYDNAGRRTLKELANGTRATMIYDAAGNMTRIANLKSNNDTISQFNYIYDPVGNKIQITTAAGGLTTYAYDATYRLTEEHRTTSGLSWAGMSANDWGDLSADGWSTMGATSGAGSYQNTYSYDPTGNRVLTVKDGARTTSTFDPANQNVYSESSDGRTTYTFDNSGNRTGVEKPDGSRTTTTYDYENRNIAIHLPSGIRNTMAYDPDGLRVLLQDSSGTKKFVYDNQQYLLKTNGSNIITAVYTQEPGTYSNLISQYRFDGSLWVPSYHHYDSLGDTSELTDASEEVTDTYQYNSWGELLAHTGTTPNPLQYRGRYGYFTNPDTGEVYVIMRTYDPVTGRWTTLDILRFVDGLNMYLAYFVPMKADPSGLVPVECSCFWPEPPEFGTGGGSIITTVVDCQGLGTRCCEQSCGRLDVVNWRIAPPNPNRAAGIYLCQRDVEPGTPCGECINALGGQHVYIQFGSVNPDGSPQPGTTGVGFSGGKAGNPPSPERAFKPTQCRALSATGDQMKYGSGAGSPSSSAKPGEIEDCIRNALTSNAYHWKNYNCYAWANEALQACGLKTE
jgi:RHS repeat-associated core domain